MNYKELKTKLHTKIVGIAGAGGLGSNCAVALARVGVGQLVIADFDKVEHSNLNRQYYFSDQVGMPKVQALKDNIARIDPKISIVTHQVRLNFDNIPVIFNDCDVLVEAFDKAEMKMIMVESVLDNMPGKDLVCGVGLAGWGKNDMIKMRSYDNIYICGDQTYEVSEESPPLAPRVGIVANMEANQVLELLLGKM
jgi:sulfur carrier protein ThiS adenylyltransferase